ncbi:hypothetical protein KY362_07905 [Candidatus Woesearchaeota archaeon]|nr:hypothetical protein [Candidatus Woesearchaeota archaeon]
MIVMKKRAIKRAMQEDFKPYIRAIVMKKDHSVCLKEFNDSFSHNFIIEIGKMHGKGTDKLVSVFRGLRDEEFENLTIGFEDAEEWGEEMLSRDFQRRACQSFGKAYGKLIGALYGYLSSNEHAGEIESIRSEGGWDDDEEVIQTLEDVLRKTKTDVEKLTEAIHNRFRDVGGTTDFKIRLTEVKVTLQEIFPGSREKLIAQVFDAMGI